VISFTWTTLRKFMTPYMWLF